MVGYEESIHTNNKTDIKKKTEINIENERALLHEQNKWLVMKIAFMHTIIRKIKIKTK